MHFWRKHILLCFAEWTWETSERVIRPTEKILARDWMKRPVMPSQLHYLCIYVLSMYIFKVNYILSVPTPYLWPYWLCKGYLLTKMLFNTGSRMSGAWISLQDIPRFCTPIIIYMLQHLKESCFLRQNKAYFYSSICIGGSLAFDKYFTT